LFHIFVKGKILNGRFVESVVMDIFNLAASSSQVIVISYSVKLEIQVATDWEVLLHRFKLLFGFV